MSKFIIEVTPEQLVSLSAIITSISINNYSKLHLFQDDTNELMKCLKNAKSINEESDNNQVDIVNNYDYIPKEFHETYNLVCEDTDGTLISSSEENLRFIYGKQGQIGIEFWEYYEEDSFPDTIVFINNSDARELLERINRITNNFEFDRGKLLNSIESIEDKYQIKISNNANGMVAILCKKLKTGSIDLVAFSNEHQIRLFYEFLKYHLVINRGGK